MSVAGGVAVRDRLFDELQRLDAEEERIRSRRTEIRNTLRVLAELGAIDLDTEDGNGRRPNQPSGSEAPEPRVAPDPPRSTPTSTAAPGRSPAAAPRAEKPAPEKPAPEEGPCPACGEEMAIQFLASHISRVHKLPKAKEFNPERFDELLATAGWSDGELAGKLEGAVGVAPGVTTIANWRKGRSQPGLPFVEALADLLGCTTGDLVWRKR